MSHDASCGDFGGRATKCDKDRRNNVWIEGGNPETGEGGICLLDTVTDEQVIYCIERDHRARVDLVRVTSDPHLLELAERVPRLAVTPEGDALQKAMNEGSGPEIFYRAFRGQPPFAQ